jgi:hypothetical protein
MELIEMGITTSPRGRSPQMPLAAAVAAKMRAHRQTKSESAAPDALK